MDFFDSHAHLSSPQIYPQVEDVLNRALEKSVTGIVNICTDQDTLEKGLLIAKEHEGIFNAGATTPHDVEKEGEAFFPLFKKHAKDFVAIGETGLDYHYEHSPKELQKKFLKKYLHLAWDLHLPVIFHCREAFADLFAICDAECGGKSFNAVLHCFTGTLKEAEECLKRGWMISFSGIVTYKKSESLREVAKETPIDHVLIETDSPYLAPQKNRGKQNEPSFIYETAEVIAKEKGLEVVEVALQTRKNAVDVFRIEI